MKAVLGITPAAIAVVPIDCTGQSCLLGALSFLIHQAVTKLLHKQILRPRFINQKIDKLGWGGHTTQDPQQVLTCCVSPSPQPTWRTPPHSLVLALKPLPLRMFQLAYTPNPRHAWSFFSSQILESMIVLTRSCAIVVMILRCHFSFLRIFFLFPCLISLCSQGSPHCFKNPKNIFLKSSCGHGVRTHPIGCAKQTFYTLHFQAPKYILSKGVSTERDAGTALASHDALTS